MIRMLKSITTKQLFQRYPEVKEKLWGKILDSWILCKYSWTIFKQGSNQDICEKSRNEERI
jgi:hypothetical protein